MLGYSLRLYLYSLPASVLLLWGEVGVFYILELLEATCLASSRRLRMMSVTCILAVCSALLHSGVYLLEGGGGPDREKISWNQRARRQKRRKRKKGQGKRKDKCKKDRARTMFHKTMGNLEKMQVIGNIIAYYFPYYFICRAKKSTKIRLGENIW